MIAFFPEIYPDELLYSQLARYYAKAGYISCCHAAEDLFLRPAVRPDKEFINAFTDVALEIITQTMTMEEIILKHTMFNYYGRFLPKERRAKAFKALLNMENKYYNLLTFPKRKSSRYLRYCPLCTADDRECYGEAYWHRLHQLQGIHICPIHGCSLLNSEIPISTTASSVLASAEEAIPAKSEITMCENQIELWLARYASEVFQSDIDFESDILAGDFLRSMSAKYRSAQGNINLVLFNEDFQEYYQYLPDNWLSELWTLKKVLANKKLSLYEICMVGLFLGVPTSDLAHMELPEQSQEQPVKRPAGEMKHVKEPKQPSKSSTQTKDRGQLDIELLPTVKRAIEQLTGDGITRPRKVTPYSVGKIIGLRQAKINSLPMCKAEIEKYRLSRNEYWALELVWAAKTLIRDGRSFNYSNLTRLTSMKNEAVISCLPYVPKYADDELYKKIVSVYENRPC